MKKYVSPKLEELKLEMNERIATCVEGSVGPNPPIPNVGCIPDDPTES